MTITEGDADELAGLQERYQLAQAEADEIVEPTRREFYAKILAIADGDGGSKGTQEEIASVLGVSRPRAKQLIDQARRAFR